MKSRGSLQLKSNFARCPVCEHKNISKHELLDLMQPLSKLEQLETQIASFINQGLIEEDKDETFRLNPEGLEKHQIALVRQQDLRKQAVKHISQDEYQIAVKVLRQMTKNLETLS